MKLLTLFLILTSFQVHAADIMAGMRESFISAKNFPYGGDSTARLRKSIKKQGFDYFVLNTKLSTSKLNTSYVFRPRWSSNMRDLETMISYIRLGGGRAVIKPQLVLEDDLVTITPYEVNVSNVNKNLLLHTYQRELNGYLRLSNKTELDSFIIGSGLSGLYRDSSFTKSLLAMHKNVRKGLNDKTELGLHLNGVETLLTVSKNKALVEGIKNTVDVIYYPVNDLPVFNSRNTKSDMLAELEDLLLKHKSIFGDIKFALSDVVLPICKKIEQFCEKGIKDSEARAVLESFSSTITELEKLYDISAVELVTSTTNYEPDTPDKRFLYYRDFFTTLNVKELFGQNEAKRIDPPLSSLAPKGKKACVFYDVKDNGPIKDMMGRVHSTMLVSLLGAFPAYDAKRFDINDYQKGDLSACNKAFYIASNFGLEVPSSFLKDAREYVKTKNLLWFNYKANKLLKDSGLSFEVPFILSPNRLPTRYNHDIGFFQYFEYKGEEFFKKSGWSATANNFLSSPELHKIKINNKEKVDVLSLARHNKTGEKTPYIVKENIQKGQFWYVADLPFSFVHYEDRYLILTDILWDFLEVDAPTGPPKAMVRFEDINPSLDLADLNWAMQYLGNNDVPFSLAVIPYFADMMGQTTMEDYKVTFKPITKYPDFIASLKYADKLGADMVWHGVAHQVDDYLSGYNGVSGSDYEFWLYPENTPIPYDSVDWVMDRLTMGEDIFREIGITPVAWEIPHYAASVLDYYIFGKVFEWTYHRSVIFDHSVKRNSEIESDTYMFDCLSKECRERRRALLRNIEVDADYSTFGASLYPYPIYKDAYGQKVMPETLGMIDFAFYSPNTWRPVNKPEDIIRRAKKLKVIRGAYASFFWHSILLSPQARYYSDVPGSYETIGGKNSLRLIVTELKKMGYEFVSISDCSLFPQKRCRK